MLLLIEHLTQYVYSAQVNYSIQHLRLTPSSDQGQHVITWHIEAKGALDAYQDAYHNHCHTLVMDGAHDGLMIAVYGEVETGVASPSTNSLPPSVFLQTTALTNTDPALQQFAFPYRTAQPLQLMQAIHARIAYLTGVTDVATDASRVFALAAGVCQDHAHVMLACCRFLGWPARYVSGYLFTEAGRLMQSHAWVEVWHAGHWQGWDVSNGMAVNECYVRLAVGLDYRSACPVSGSRIGGGAEGMASQVRVLDASDNARLQINRQTHQQIHHSLLQQAQAAQQ